MTPQHYAKHRYIRSLIFKLRKAERLGDRLARTVLQARLDSARRAS